MNKLAFLFLFSILVLFAGLPAVENAGAALAADEICLFFPEADGAGLALEKRRLDITGSLAERAGLLMTELAAGPGKNLAPAFLPGMTFRRCYAGREGILYLDIAFSERRTAVTVNEERLCIWALVDTLYANLPDLSGVRILAGGVETPTLAGHIDISRLLRPDPLLAPDFGNACGRNQDGDTGGSRPADPGHSSPAEKK